MLGLSVMKTYSSGEDFLNAVSDLISRIEKSGTVNAARELRSGFSCLNGLTDGWALFMESIETVLKVHGQRLSSDQHSELNVVLKTVKHAVYR